MANIQKLESNIRKQMHLQNTPSTFNVLGEILDIFSEKKSPHFDFQYEGFKADGEALARDWEEIEMDLVKSLQKNPPSQLSQGSSPSVRAAIAKAISRISKRQGRQRLIIRINKSRQRNSITVVRESTSNK